MAFAAGQPLTASALNAAIGSVWTAYTPVWTCATSNPSIGNGSLAGSYTKVGKTVTVRINLLVGSTTTFGSGAFRFTLPETSATYSGFTNLPIWVGSAYGFDNGTANRGGDVNVWSGATYCTVTGNGTGGQWDAGTPMTWANLDAIALTFSYEAATF
ncbi:hypothetical protein [Lentzea sp. NBRC 102530]|uniref:hypothetical protein n=1 Tax=Lentzea sp. NBRC 102530 TaxID=3032201 RepID=UPI0024A3293A|nr:hypothetical protein [Lentzea sp. NBRC 102530]GLY55176.1 hypothetical protein Lesp01_88310 [Lentzea sp. NBRC 102530]